MLFSFRRILLGALWLVGAPVLAQRPPGVPPLFVPLAPAVGTALAAPVSPYFTGYAGAHLPIRVQPDLIDYKVEELDFLYRYGASDTAAALIHLYFRRRNGGHWLFLSALVPLSVALTGRRYEKSPTTGQSLPVDKPYVDPFAYTALGLQGAGLLKSLIWNRRALYDELIRFQQTRRLSRSLNRRLRPHLIKTRNHEYGD